MSLQTSGSSTWFIKVENSWSCSEEGRMSLVSFKKKKICKFFCPRYWTILSRIKINIYLIFTISGVRSNWFCSGEDTGNKEWGKGRADCKKSNYVKLSLSKLRHLRHPVFLGNKTQHPSPSFCKSKLHFLFSSHVHLSANDVIVLVVSILKLWFAELGEADLLHMQVILCICYWYFSQNCFICIRRCFWKGLKTENNSLKKNKL